MFPNPNITRAPYFDHSWIAILGFVAAALGLTAAAQGQIDGFVEPFQRIELASDETGCIAKLNVEEGDHVNEGDPIACLDQRVQQLQMEIAEKLANNQSELTAARETLSKRQAILDRLKKLQSNGHASESEVIRAEMELSIAEAKLLSVKEEQAVRQVEMKRAEVQLERRTITAPISGVVATIHRRQGEYLSPLHPDVVTLIQVDKLLATFAVPGSQASLFQPGSEFELQLGNGKTVTGTLYRVGVETDAQSGTIEIKLMIENPNHEIRSGESVTLKI